MINYIPNDYYSANKNKIYAREEDCKKEEGSALPFDQAKLELKKCIIENGEVKECPIKSAAFEAGRSSQAKALARSRAYKKIDPLLFEALAEKEEGRPEKLQAYLALRAQVKQENPL